MQSLEDAGSDSGCVFIALAFGLYHGNWIQGIYGFVFGLLLAWGYEMQFFWKVQDGCADAWGCQWGGGALQYGF